VLPLLEHVLYFYLPFICLMPFVRHHHQEALRLGLLLDVVEPDRLLPAAKELAGRIAAAAPGAVSATLQVSSAALLLLLLGGVGGHGDVPGIYSNHHIFARAPAVADVASATAVGAAGGGSRARGS
jgi:hypothetical protein